MKNALTVVQLTTDNREPFREYHKVTPWFGTAPEALLQGFAALPGVKVHVVTCAQRPMAGSPEKLADNLWFHSLHVPKLGWLRTGYQGCVRAVRRKLRELRPDVVHGQGTERECSLSAVMSGFPNVLTIHGNMRLIAQVNRPRPFTYGWLAARLESFTVPRAAGVVCITSYTQRAVQSFARRTWVVPNAVDASFFEVAPEPVPEPVILVVGQVILRKNTNAFIRALDPLAARKKFSVVFLGGAAPDDSYAREFHQLLATRPWCRFGGFAGREELKLHLRGATLLALPTLEDNCPMCVLEAMAASVPVVAARVGGVPDLIGENVTGLLCDPASADSMCAAIERALADADLRARLRDAAKSDARARFHPEVIARRHVEIYREVLRG
ncbi:MAG: glycosyltransferase family 4 protein [Verrucomicrobia bacterium]|nr:glycosyltransferase family 4 protein [Verrucomicrobiota bacterium]